MAQTRHTTTARGAHKAQSNMILESWALFGPNAVRKIVTVARWSALSCGSACTFAIPAHVTSARLRPVLRHGRGRNYFASRRTQLWHSNWEPAAALPPCPTVGCNFCGKGKMQKTIRAEIMPHIVCGKSKTSK